MKHGFIKWWSEELSRHCPQQNHNLKNKKFKYNHLKSLEIVPRAFSIWSNTYSRKSTNSQQESKSLWHLNYDLLP